MAKLASLPEFSGVIWGMPDAATRRKPVIAPGPGRVRLKFCNKSWGRGFYRDAHGIREFILRDIGHALILDPKLEQRANVRP